MQHSKHDHTGKYIITTDDDHSIVSSIDISLNETCDDQFEAIALGDSKHNYAIVIDETASVTDSLSSIEGWSDASWGVTSLDDENDANFLDHRLSCTERLPTDTTAISDVLSTDSFAASHRGCDLKFEILNEKREFISSFRSPSNNAFSSKPDLPKKMLTECARKRMMFLRHKSDHCAPIQDNNKNSAPTPPMRLSTMEKISSGPESIQDEDLNLKIPRRWSAPHLPTRIPTEEDIAFKAPNLPRRLPTISIDEESSLSSNINGSQHQGLTYPPIYPRRLPTVEMKTCKSALHAISSIR